MSPRLILAIIAVSLVTVGGFLWLTRIPAPAERPRVIHGSPHTPIPKPSGEPPNDVSGNVAPPANRPHPAKSDTTPAAEVETQSAAPTAATLRITSDVAGAQVFLDHTFIGAAPVTASDVAPGPHRLNVSATGYDGYAESIEVAAGPREIAVRFKQITLDAHLDVIHKHTFGSCKGKLSATPDGLTYEASNAGDAFTTSLVDLSGFDVNYLDKTLKLKLKSGKSFTFADPDGNADRLFVFQRDVGKVRDRLRKGD